MPMFASLRQSIERASTDAKDLFLSATAPNNRETYFAKGKLGDNGTGAVYAYFDKEGQALYVGVTGRTIKMRQHDQTSPHKKTTWWDRWETVRFIQISSETDRLTLELLLILALKPPHNSKPGPRDFAAMFSS
ncbi:hypothetical protein C1Y08_27950 [Pseudomonas sp. FW306-02-F02-AA]|uniref:GIY-YIG nuclease family protein n=1 Tax=Pseudomonas TaxID=286 RepID=UPI000C886B4B|nr:MULTISPECIES: GIY-YIG nuclease family protein [Pseudomonas]PMZ05651.1 hypothetical protein C1Y07_04295 [Pseudomonas sp. FW306-02-F02-AB]PMZ11220.1 hypothetical protein C1Y06_06080 [Pseudomonas sp. FW306-02-H06C]PMZ12648.1 hypothetical protein C1Y08_27950 [Pseudomonas sp. FW306-02-F02-AA]PMZ23421.1 hypothetical protein C1Y09_04375 [Pseudomonas sp. FW306-02-F08-AA]PMZ29249.1 hypothetical protein C1Y05_04780 [Pseudomonas sp. FW306-02-F04-BA]